MEEKQQFPSVSVFGLGYVGSVTAACLAERGCRVIGCDVQQAKVDQIKEGAAPISEPGLDELMASQVAAGKLSATTDAAEAVRESEISLVCVGTPSTASGGLDLRYVEAVAQQIAAAVEAKEGSHAVVFRSTMLPGSTRKMAEAFFGGLLESGKVSIYFFPEFLRQGTALADFQDPSLSAIGTLEENAATEAVAPILDAETEPMALESAELLKYACNAFHATKVAFANEIGRIGKALGIDSTTVMAQLCRDERLNISKYYLRPGTPFGGSCLPKDVSALSLQARALNVFSPTIDSLLESNRRHLESLIERVEAAKAREVLLIGLAFKAGTDDLRGSAMVELVASLLMKDYAVKIYDPDVAPRNLIGANQRFATAKLPALDTLLVDDLAAALDHSPQTIVASKPCADLDVMKKNLHACHHVIDVNGWPQLAEIAPSYEGLCW
mgnify:CR=1 FL=1